MSRDRQIAVLASIVGLAGLIVGIVAISQVSGAEDDWVRNRALPGAASSEGAVLQTQVAVQEVADLRERVAELEKTPVPARPEEVAPTVELPTEEVDYAETRSDPPVTTPSSVEETAPSSVEETAPSSVEETTIDAPIGLYGYNDYGDSDSEFQYYSSGEETAIYDAPIGMKGYYDYGDSDSEFQDYPWQVFPRSHPAYIDSRYRIKLNRADTQEALLEVADDYASYGMAGESSTRKPGVKFIDDRYLRLEIQCNAEHLRVWLYPHRVNLAKSANGHVNRSPAYYNDYNAYQVYPSAIFKTRTIALSSYNSKVLSDADAILVGKKVIILDQIPGLLLDVPFYSSDGVKYYGTTAYSDTYLLLVPDPFTINYNNSAVHIHLRGKTEPTKKTCEVSYTGIFGHETLHDYSLACWSEPEGCGP
jgi:hypothetical protein